MIMPMNAKPAGDKQELLLSSSQYIAEIKIDGYRAICEDGLFTSRLGNDFSDKVPHLVRVMSEYHVTIDGELTLGINSSNVTTVLGSLTARALAKQAELGNIKFTVFDMLGWQGTSIINWTWDRRRRLLMDFYDDCLNGEHDIELSGVYNDKKELLAYANRYGHEGIMLKNKDSLYYPDKRPEHCWYKVKKSITYDVVVMGYEEGKGKFAGLIGSMVFGLYDDGVLTECGKCSGMDDITRLRISENRAAFIGSVIEIGAMEITKDQHFRHPAFKGFRLDKRPEQCIFQ